MVQRPISGPQRSSTSSPAAGPPTCSSAPSGHLGSRYSCPGSSPPSGPDLPAPGSGSSQHYPPVEESPLHNTGHFLIRIRAQIYKTFLRRHFFLTAISPLTIDIRRKLSKVAIPQKRLLEMFLLCFLCFSLSKMLRASYSLTTTNINTHTLSNSTLSHLRVVVWPVPPRWPVYWGW